jgi:NitT/TauT family transport system permease protein
MISRSMTKTVLPPILLLLVLIGAWQLFIQVYEIKKFVMPTPLAVLGSFQRDGLDLLKATGVTALAAGCGFLGSLILGSIVAVGFAESKIVRTSCYPYAILLQTVPVVAIAPLIIIWSGSGFRSVVIISFIISLFPIITNGCTGMLAIDSDLMDLFRLHRASRWRIIVKLRLPNSVPYLMTGAKISSGLAIIGAIVGDFLVGHGQDKYGLGFLILQSRDRMRTDKLFAAVICSTLLGVLIFAGMSVLSRTILKRWSIEK